LRAKSGFLIEAVATPHGELMETLAWDKDHLRLLDQTRLPAEEVYLHLTDYRQVAEAIRSMRVRGAPALGCAAAYGVALAAASLFDCAFTEFQAGLAGACVDLVATRPTAVNIAWAVSRMQRAIEGISRTDLAVERLLEEAIEIQEEDVRNNREMGRHGAVLIDDGCTVLTHCNAGALATAGYGTALGVIRAAVEAGKHVQVFADETRPLLQGARLTAWELTRDGIPTTLIADTMAGHFMQHGEIDCVIVGADRIAANGDVANKIGTYQVAVLAHTHGIPFYVAAPFSTVDLSARDGSEIPIEERAGEEVSGFHGLRTAPAGVEVRNPAFDVTPHRYVSAIITEQGIVRPPFESALRGLDREHPVEGGMAQHARS
jgi:methylthioribose-1-phosphate isomerase